jgi:voltage-gated potassium channel
VTGVRPRWSRPHSRFIAPYAFNPLRRSFHLPIWADLLLRLGAAGVLVFLVVMIHWFDRAGLRDSYDQTVSFLDVVYFTMVSITTTGFGDITPVSSQARLIETVVVTPIRLAVIFIFFGTAYTFLIKGTWEKWRMTHIQERLTGHIVVLGYGVSGENAVRELIERGTDPVEIVVLDPRQERLAAAEAAGCNVMLGDAARDETLIALRIANARTVLISAGRDDTSILITLTARHVAPNVPITTVVRAVDNELLARQAGADNVINPVHFTGLLLAGSAQGSHIADYLIDLASVSGRVQLVERPVRPEEVGCSLDQLSSGGRGLRIYRGPRIIGFWEPDAGRLEPGDLIVEVVGNSQPSAQNTSPITR